MGSSMAVALLLPMTFTLDPTGAFIMFAGVYFGGLFGDSTMAILLNTPGQSSAIASTFEGHRMANSGRAPQALSTAAIGAFVGGMIACALLVFVAPSLVALSSQFGAAEFFALAMFAFIATSSVVRRQCPEGRRTNPRHQPASLHALLSALNDAATHAAEAAVTTDHPDGH